MPDREKMLKIAKKADLWAKGELRFTAGSQGHAKKHWQARIIQSAPLKGSNSHKYRCTNAPACKHTYKQTLKKLRGKDNFKILSSQQAFVHLASFVTFRLPLRLSKDKLKTLHSMTFSGGML